MNNSSGCNNFNNLPIRESIIARFEYQRYSSQSTNIEWRKCIDHPDYEISNSGLIRHTKSYGGEKRVLIQTLRFNKYLYVTLSVNGKRKGFAVDRLLLSTFNNIPYAAIRKVFHSDCCLQNNCIENLSFKLHTS
jgi:hypothetical protein